MDVNRGGLCFLCLIKLECPASASIGMYSFNGLHQYLTCDSKTWSAFQNDRRKFKVPLCDGCAPVNNQFTKYYRRLQKVELAVESCLQIIYERMTTQVSSSNEDASNEESYSDLKVARDEVMQKCSRTIMRIQQHSHNLSGNGKSKRKRRGHSGNIPVEQDGVKFQVKAPKIEELDSSSDSDHEAHGTFVIDQDQEETVEAPSSPIAPRSSETNDTDIERPICNINPETGKSTNLKMSYKCELCPKLFRRLDSLTVHLRNVHQQGVENDRFSCELCQKTFNRKWFLKKHNETEHKIAKIGDTPPKVPQWRAHCTFNQGTGKYRCNHCPTEFKEERYFQDHYAGSHLNLKLECPHPHCGKSFPQRSSLRRHQQNIHMGLRFNCKNCAKSFTLKTYLNLHLRTTKCGGGSDIESPKSPPNPICHLCGKTFTKQYGLQLHLKTVHSQAREHQCELCGKEFKTRTHLKTHRKGVHMGINKAK